MIAYMWLHTSVAPKEREGDISPISPKQKMRGKINQMDQINQRLKVLKEQC